MSFEDLLIRHVRRQEIHLAFFEAILVLVVVVEVTRLVMCS